MAENYFTAGQTEWLKLRRGKITSSEYHKLTKGGRRDMTEEELAEEKKRGGKRKTIDTLFGEGAITYITSRITEMQSSEIKEEMDFKQTEWGKNNEAAAAEHFEAITGLSIIHYGISCPQFFPYGDYAGGSPDFEVVDEPSIGEIKCPYDENVHTRRLLIKSIDQFKEEEPEAWHQCQMNTFIMGKEACYYASFDPRRIDPTLRMKIIKIKACPVWQEDFKIRHDAAINLMADILFDTSQYLFVE